MEENKMRLCKVCNEEKEETEFRGNWSTCKKCVRDKRISTNEENRQRKDNVVNYDFGEPKKVEIELPETEKLEKKPKNTKVFKMEKSKLKDAVNGTLFAVFNMIGEGAGEHWKLKPTESEILAEPITEIIADLEESNILMENMKYISLGIACFSVFTPKIMKEFKLRKGGNINVKKQPEKSNNNSEQQEFNAKRENKNSSEKNNVPSNHGKYTKSSFIENSYADVGEF